MRWRHRGKDIVIALALLAAGAYGSYLFIRSQGGFTPGWTDGDILYESVRGKDIRFAVWEAPERVANDVNSEAVGGRSALSPDGRFLVFEVGERGLNAKRWADHDPEGQAN